MKTRAEGPLSWRCSRNKVRCVDIMVDEVGDSNSAVREKGNQ